MSGRRIKLKIWKVSMDLFPPEDDLDNSIVNEYGRCPRKGFYRYGLRRGFAGTNYPIQFGLAYHKYRDIVENLMRAQSSRMTEEIHLAAVDKALEGFIDPPLDDKKGYLDRGRFFRTCTEAKERIIREQLSGTIEITRNEDAFDLELPFYQCRDCHWTFFTPDGDACPNCYSTNVYVPRHGGRIDQFVKAIDRKGALLFRDFKTKSYDVDPEEVYDPDNQCFGYTWAEEELSGRKVDGALIEMIYNTKTKGPRITQHYITYSAGQIEQWIGSMMMERQMIKLMWSRVEELGYLAFPQRTNECSSWSGCPFRDACRSGSAFELEAWLKANTIESVWDYTDPDGEESKI